MKEICPVCKTPRNLREQVLDKVLAIVKKEYTPNPQVNAGLAKAINRIRSLKDKPNEPTA